MKRVLSVLIAGALCLCMAGCGADNARIQELEERVAVLEYRLEQLEQGNAPVPQPQENPSENPFETTWASGEEQKNISTLEEAVAFLDAKHPELWMSAHLGDGNVDYWWVRSGEEIVQCQPEEAVGRSCVVNAVTYLLQDDMQIYTVIGFRHDENGGIPMMAINCIETETGYTFVDPVRQMRGDAMSRYGALLPEGEVSSLEEYVTLALSDEEIRNTLDYLYLFEGGVRFEFREEDGLATLLSPEVEPIFRNEARLQEHERQAQIKLARIDPKNIGDFQISEMLGGTTLTPEEAMALVDAAPETVQEQVKTAADLLMYMLAAKIGDNGGCYCDSWDGYTWHSNFTAKEVMERKLANCGSCANLANYLLEGDYPEVGFINHAYYPGNGGGHVYNYILYQGQYYIVDFSWYLFAEYAPENDFPVMKLNKLEEFGNRVHDLYDGVSLVIAYTSTGQHLPNIFGEEFGDSHYYVPEGAQYAVLYQSGDGYLIGEMPLNTKYHDWTRYW